MQNNALTPPSLSSRIASHKAMAIAALHADSSLATRLERYNYHMGRARSLELLHSLARALRVGGGQ